MTKWFAKVVFPCATLFLTCSAVYCDVITPEEPLDEESTPFKLEHILVTHGNKVQEIDVKTEKVTWQYVNLRGTRPIPIYSAQRLKGGHTLIVAALPDSLENGVIEVDRNGTIVWERRDPDIFRQNLYYDAQRLKNRNTLICGETFSGQYNWGKCWEYDMDPNSKTPVWSYQDFGAVRMTEGDRLEDSGNTLLSTAGYRGVIEIDPQNHVVWSYGVGLREDATRIFAANDADRLDKETTLITGTFNTYEEPRPLVREIKSTGEIVWEYTDLTVGLYSQGPEDADRLPDGTTIIADTGANRIILVDQAGEIVWKYTTPDPPLDVDAIPPSGIIK